MFATESFPALYQQAIAQLMREGFTAERIFGRIATFETALSSHLTKEEAAALRMGVDGDEKGYNRAVERTIMAIKPFVRRRVASVNAQLAGSREGTRIEGRRRGARPSRGGPDGRGRGSEGPEGRRPPPRR